MGLVLYLLIVLGGFLALLWGYFVAMSIEEIAKRGQKKMKKGGCKISNR